MYLIRLFIHLLKQWTLVVSMIVGVFGYLLYVNIHSLDSTHHFVRVAAETIQPILITVMLFLAFCKTDPAQLKPHRWMFHMVAIQMVPFIMTGILLAFHPEFRGRLMAEGLMLCMICPTATAASVVVNKLKGNANTVVSYTLIIYLLVSIAIPVVFSFIDHTHGKMNIMTSFFMIARRIFPMLILPMVASWLVRYLLPRWHRVVSHYANSAFYLWAICLTLAIGISMNSLYHTKEPVSQIVGLAVISLITCVIQFYIGHLIGKSHHNTVAATQSLGQKNTAFIIWFGYTFLNPVTSIVGGCYAIWQNIINSWQLYRHQKNMRKGS